MELNPVELYYKDEGDGIPVVLLHGFPLDHTIWQPVIPYLKGKARVISPDLRGYGKSPDRNEIHSMRLLVEDILVLIDRLKLDQVILVGHSMGGYVSLSFAQAYPHRLSGLGLISTQADEDTPERRQARLRTARDVRTKGADLIAHGMPAKLTKNPEIQQQLHELMHTLSPKAVIQSLKGMAERQDANAWLPTIKVPALVITGEQDQLIPMQRSREMVTLLNKGWIIEIPEAGHMPMMEAPQKVADGLMQLVAAASEN